MRANASQYAAQTAVKFEGQKITWEQLWQAVEPRGRQLASLLGGDKQVVVAILLPNSIEFIVNYLAIVHSGHIALLLDPAYKQLELDAIIDQMEPKFMITNDHYSEQVSARHRQLILPKSSPQGPDMKTELLRLPADKQIASLTFTGGTTGQPKAVPNTHANHVWNIKVCSQVWGWTHQDTLLISVPLSHMLGIVMGLSGALYHGNTIYLHKWFDETATLEALASGKISFFSHAASAYSKLLQGSSKNYDLSGVRLCVSGAAPLPPAVWQEFKNRYRIEIVETYGTSETGRIAGQQLNERRVGSPGRPLPEVDLRLSPTGEVEIKSPGVFPGYFNSPAATKSSRTPDGYWRTGDIAELKDGYLYLKGRTKERIRRFGYTISPRDIEWALYKHPQIVDAYVMGFQRASEPSDELVYFLVSSLPDKEILSFTKQNLIFAWRPDRIIHLDELPRTPSGKVSIGKLEEMVESK